MHFVELITELGVETMSEDIRIYVADLAAYNNGYLHGVWIHSMKSLTIWKARLRQMKSSTSQ